MGRATHILDMILDMISENIVDLVEEKMPSREAQMKLIKAYALVKMYQKGDYFSQKKNFKKEVKAVAAYEKILKDFQDKYLDGENLSQSNQKQLDKQADKWLKDQGY